MLKINQEQLKGENSHETSEKSLLVVVPGMSMFSPQRRVWTNLGGTRKLQTTYSDAVLFPQRSNHVQCIMLIRFANLRKVKLKDTTLAKKIEYLT